MTHTHLTQDERYQIYILKKAGLHPSEIAKLMNHHPYTISRETLYQHIHAGKRAGDQWGIRPSDTMQASQQRDDAEGHSHSSACSGDCGKPLNPAFQGAAMLC
ncbi:MAG: helix-turn-helix domain-containing protein [Thiobacillus sp.]|nr:helix-turn-helix domain-containing protein [Thiobacillus sp.]